MYVRARSFNLMGSPVRGSTIYDEHFETMSALLGYYSLTSTISSTPSTSPCSKHSMFKSGPHSTIPLLFTTQWSCIHGRNSRARIFQVHLDTVRECVHIHGCRVQESKSHDMDTLARSGLPRFTWTGQEKIIVATTYVRKERRAPYMR